MKNVEKIFPMKKLLATFIFCACLHNINAQDQPASGDEPATVHTLAQMLRLQATITPAWNVSLLSGDKVASISGGRTNVYIHGTAEYYFDERFSMRGDIYYFLNKNKIPGGLKHNHGFQVGGSWHLIKGSSIDPFIGLRAGMNLTQIYPMDFDNKTGLVWVDYAVPAHLDPVWGPHLGVNFYGEKIFHFFVEGAYLIGMYRPNKGPQLSLEELRVSVGLGWNFSLYKGVETIRKKI